MTFTRLLLHEKRSLLKIWEESNCAHDLIIRYNIKKRYNDGEITYPQNRVETPMSIYTLSHEWSTHPYVCVTRQGRGPSGSPWRVPIETKWKSEMEWSFFWGKQGEETLVYTFPVRIGNYSQYSIILTGN